MIVGITAQQGQRLGSGKTLFAVLYVYRLYRKLKKHGYKVYSNISLYGIPYTRITRLGELSGIDKAIILLDDVYKWVDAYRHASRMNTLVTVLGTESRKAHHYIVWTSARYVGGAHKGLRDLSEIIFLSTFQKKFRLLSVTPCIDVGDRLLPIGRTQRYGPKTVTFLYKTYNTFERVLPIES